MVSKSVYNQFISIYTDPQYYYLIYLKSYDGLSLRVLYKTLWPVTGVHEKVETGIRRMSWNKYNNLIISPL